MTRSLPITMLLLAMLASAGGGCSSGGRKQWAGLFNLAFIFGSVLLLRRRLRR